MDLRKIHEHSEKLTRQQGEAFDIWFEREAATNNPMMPREEARRIFDAGYQSGFTAMLMEMMRVMLDGRE